jgi:hypothetical protein
MRRNCELSSEVPVMCCVIFKKKVLKCNANYTISALQACAAHETGMAYLPGKIRP